VKIAHQVAAVVDSTAHVVTSAVAEAAVVVTIAAVAAVVVAAADAANTVVANFSDVFPKGIRRNPGVLFCSFFRFPPRETFYLREGSFSYLWMGFEFPVQ
jgi:hypothetical protein